MPWTSPLHIVPAITQHVLPAFFPSWTPSSFVFVEAGHTPIADAFSPPGSLPHFLNSQQFFFTHCLLAVSAYILSPSSPMTFYNSKPRRLSREKAKIIHFRYLPIVGQIGTYPNYSLKRWRLPGRCCRRTSPANKAQTGV